MRRHMNTDSRSSMDYLMAVISKIEFNEGKTDITTNEFYQMALQLVTVGSKIAESTVNLSILKGLQHAGEYLTEWAEDKSEKDILLAPLSQFHASLSKRIEYIEAETSYAAIIEEAKEKKNYKEAAGRLFELAQTKKEKKETMITSYMPPQMAEGERIQAIAKATETKLEELFHEAFKTDIGLESAELLQGDAAKTASGLTGSVTKAVVGGVAGLAKGLLPKAFGINEMAEGKLKELGDKYLTNPATEKVESTLDQTEGKNRATLLQFFLSLEKTERQAVAKAFSELLAATFPYAMEHMVVNQYDAASMDKIANKLVETSLYRCSKQGTNETNGNRKSSNTN